PDGGLAPRPVVLRTFAAARGDRFQVLEGGLATAAAPGRQLLGARSGAISKDLWVLAPRPGDTAAAPSAPTRALEPSPRAAPPPSPRTAPEPAGPVAPLVVLSPRVAADMFWLGRYAERAEGTARLLRAVTDRWADFQSSPDPAGRHALEALLRATT